LGGLSGLSNLGMGSANFMEMQQQIQSGMMGNPDFMRQVMDSPLTQSLMSNPEILRGLIQSNPQMREVTFINRKNINDNLKSFFKKTKFYFNF
jgi:ubiquilin